MYIQYMLCPKQEFITEPAKPKMNPMFDDIKTWLNHAGILFNGPAHFVRVQEFKFNRSALGCAVASTAGVDTIPTLWGPISGTWSCLDLRESSQSTHTPMHSQVDEDLDD